MAGQLLLANPRKRRKRRSPSRSRTRRRMRRNPIGARGIASTFTKGAVGAAGALAVDVAMARLPIPAQFQTGPIGALTRGGVGIGLGMLVSRVGRNKRLGENLADGAVTVALYNTGKSLIGPQLGLSDASLLGYEWLNDDDDLGYISPAQTMDMQPDHDMGFIDIDEPYSM